MDPDRRCEFDAYLMVDWSSNNEPKRGSDSIWYCLAERVEGRLQISKPANPGTRMGAFQQIQMILADLARRKSSTLAGFDFPYGYPKGFTRALRLPGVEPWKEIWTLLSDEIRDDEKNRSNRFEVAARLNQRVSSRAFPFWGCPPKQEGPCLTMKREIRYAHGEFTEFRSTDKGSMQPVWKLCYPGSVGSQALVGIPYVARLRFEDRELSSVSRVWPFETGFTLKPRLERDWTILHTEIYPSILRSQAAAGECKDEAQVRCLAEHFARQDEDGSLWQMFQLPRDIGPAEVVAIQSEEGWTLGVK